MLLLFFIIFFLIQSFCLVNYIYFEFDAGFCRYFHSKNRSHQWNTDGDLSEMYINCFVCFGTIKKLAFQLFLLHFILIPFILVRICIVLLLLFGWAWYEWALRHAAKDSLVLLLLTGIWMLCDKLLKFTISISQNVKCCEKGGDAFYTLPAGKKIWLLWWYLIYNDGWHKINENHIQMNCWSVEEKRSGKKRYKIIRKVCN